HGLRIIVTATRAAHRISYPIAYDISTIVCSRSASLASTGAGAGATSRLCLNSEHESPPVVHHRFDLWKLPAWFGQRLAQQYPDLQSVQRDSYEGIETHLRDAEAVFTISLRPDQFAAARTLRWIHTPSAAVHQMLFPELIDSSVILTNSREVHGPVVAEHVVALMFALAKKIPQSVLLQQKCIWG